MYINVKTGAGILVSIFHLSHKRFLLQSLYFKISVGPYFAGFVFVIKMVVLNFFMMHVH